MKTKLYIVALASLGLAACSQPQGAGFSGIGFEGGAVAGAAPVSETRLSTSQVRPLPFHQATSGSGTLSDMAEIAIRTGGTVPGRSTLVQVSGQPLAMSLVQVDQTPFAVLRVPSGQSTARMDKRTQTAFAEQLGGLTGCKPASGVYGLGNPKRDLSGLAAALDCS